MTGIDSHLSEEPILLWSVVRTWLCTDCVWVFVADSSESGSHKVSNREPSGRGSGKASGDGKPTRVRTVLNEKQLHTLRTCYNANPRPDALMKEQLVEMTQLSPRVIRVWFQNKRCKDKKRAIAMKQQQQQEKVMRMRGPGFKARSWPIFFPFDHFLIHSPFYFAEPECD